VDSPAPLSAGPHADGPEFFFWLMAHHSKFGKINFFLYSIGKI
jgi:hypothetical protein